VVVAPMSIVQVKQGVSWYMSILTFLKRRSRVGVGIVATAAIVVGLSGVALAQQPPTTGPWPVVQISNPAPGALVPSGDIVISGVAFDPAATEGAGVSRVDLFLGNRDEGGLYLGTAVPGSDVMVGLTPGSTAAEQSFQIEVAMPANITGGIDLRAYAYSALTGNTTVLSTPIYLAISPTPMATPAPIPVASIQHLLAGAAVEFSLANPTAGDVVSTGDYVVSGTAGATIDRVQFFLGERDTGGMTLGATTPEAGKFSATVTFPTSAIGGHDFVAYAYSSATGQESKVSVPIYIGTAPTPTPRPATTP
jgi:hypothetical protein